MSRDDGGAAGTVFVAFVLGALTGAAVALLLAPASGEETRRILSGKGQRRSEKATDAARRGRHVLRNRQQRHNRDRHRSRPRRLQPGAKLGAAERDRGESVNLSETFLGVIAVATLLMACIQVGALVAVLRLARQAQQMIADVQRDVKPLLVKVTEVADEASRTATLATAQAQKIDRLVSDLAVHVDQTAGVVQQAIITPAREGMAIVAALKAGLGALRGFRERPRHGRSADEEDPLFIG